jgi:uncharacterized protein YdcH (DUF465 family)
MKLTAKTQTELNIEEIEKSAETFANAVNTAIVTLNLSYNKLWDLPNDQLEDVLNALAQNSKLQSLFEDHNFAANSLNSIAEKIGNISNTAINTLGKELQIDNGVVSIINYN